ncbi:MAG: alpha/beta fold hydrolase [Deltaproteobacteria bacterium]|nr:alpha/beta fold hydrolase [Deltaproteobacteria bacterium]
MKSAWIAAVWVGVAFAGCKCGGEGGKPLHADAAPPMASGSASASASARALRPTNPAPKPEAVSMTAADGVKLEGSLYAGGDARAPAVILVHRMAGTRTEWTPLIERLFPPKMPLNVLTFDLRGHGTSVGDGKGKGAPGAKGGKKLAWNEFGPAEFAALSKDVQAAIQWMDRRTGGPAGAVVLVGSDIGATASVVAAKGLGNRLRGVALISPGAALRGVDIYKPFGEVLTLPNLIVAAREDNTSNEPAQALHAMSKGSRMVGVDGALHSAEYLGREVPYVWDEIADWVEERVRPQ